MKLKEPRDQGSEDPRPPGSKCREKLRAAPHDETAAVPAAAEAAPALAPPPADAAPEEARDVARVVRDALTRHEVVALELGRELDAVFREDRLVLVADGPTVLVAGALEHGVARHPAFAVVQEADGLEIDASDGELDANVAVSHFRGPFMLLPPKLRRLIDNTLYTKRHSSRQKNNVL